MVDDSFSRVRKDRLRVIVSSFGSTPPARVIRFGVELESTVIRRLNVARLRGVRGDLWGSDDGAGMGKNDSPDIRLRLRGSVTSIRLSVHSSLGRLMLEGEGKVGSAAEGLQPARFSQLDAARRRGQGW